MRRWGDISAISLVNSSAIKSGAPNFVFLGISHLAGNFSALHAFPAIEQQHANDRDTVDDLAAEFGLLHE